MRRRVNLARVLLVLMLGSMIGGPLHTGAYQETTPKVLRIWWGAEELGDNLEPQTNEFGNWSLTLLTYEGLTRLDEELNVVPAAAESWEFNANATVITFRLREDLTYSDGSPLTAERFHFAIERRCDPHLEWRGADSLLDIVGCESLNTSLDGASSPADGDAAYEAAKANLGVRAFDDRKLEIRLVRPAPYFPALARWLGYVPVKEELIAAGGPELFHDPANWIGNGPFQLVAIEPNARPAYFRFEPNERYWGGRAKLDAIEYVAMDYEAALAAYERGDLDVAPYLGADNLPALEADSVLSRMLLRLSSPNVDVFQFNLTREPFQDKQVREAFAYAFDREAYCLEINRGACTPILSWIPAGVPGAIDTDAYAFDPAKAQQALAASTYGDPANLPEVHWYYVADDPASVEIATWLANQYRQVLGVELTLTPATWDEMDAMFNDAATRPQLAESFWWSGLPDPHEWMTFWTCGDERLAEIIGYCNPAYDALVERAVGALDPEERIRLAEESQHLLLADAPAMFTFRWDNTALVKPYVVGYSPTAPYQDWPGWGTPLEVDIAPGS